MHYKSSFFFKLNLQFSFLKIISSLLHNKNNRNNDVTWEAASFEKVFYWSKFLAFETFEKQLVEIKLVIHEIP